MRSYTRRNCSLLASAEHHSINDSGTCLGPLETGELILKESSLKIAFSAFRNMQVPSSLLRTSPEKKGER